MRVNSKGYVECRNLSVRLPNQVARAANVGLTMREGLIREVEILLGVTVEDVERVQRRYCPDTDDYEITLDSNWVRPSRS